MPVYYFTSSYDFTCVYSKGFQLKFKGFNHKLPVSFSLLCAHSIFYFFVQVLCECVCLLHEEMLLNLNYSSVVQQFPTFSQPGIRLDKSNQYSTIIIDTPVPGTWVVIFFWTLCLIAPLSTLIQWLSKNNGHTWAPVGIFFLNLPLNAHEPRVLPFIIF